MNNKIKKPHISKNYLPSVAPIVTEDITHIYSNGDMIELPSVTEDPKKKIEPAPPHKPSL